MTRSGASACGTILSLRWPLLAEWLKLHPDAWTAAPGRRARRGRDEITAVYALPEAQRFGRSRPAHELDAAAVRRFATPIDVLAAALDGSNRAKAARAAGSTRPRRQAAAAAATGRRQLRYPRTGGVEPAR
jgi:hypothetical protein